MHGQDRDAVTALVRHVRLKWADTGVPIADWWDTHQLSITLLEYLIPRISREHGIGEAQRHLRDVFGFTTQAGVDSMLAEPLNPPQLPVIPATVTKDQHGSHGPDILADLVRELNVAQYVKDICARSLIGGGAPPRPSRWESSTADGIDAWLSEAQVTVFTWRTLKEILRFSTGNDVPEALRDITDRFAELGREPLAAAVSIAARAEAQCVAWLQGISISELTLIREQPEKELRRRRWLDGHSRISESYLLVPDGVPDVTIPGNTPEVPTWVKHMVFDLGGRIMHRSSGPLNLWWFVAETDEDEAGLALDNPDAYLAVTEAEGTDVLYVGVGPRSDDAILAPFYFHPDEPQSAVELLLVSLVGARLDLYRLRDERELWHLGTTTIQFPKIALSQLLDRVDATLLRVEVERPGVPPLAILAQVPEQAPLLFTMTDKAKSEQILFDLELLNDIKEADAASLVTARAALADAEFARVSMEGDGVADAIARSDVAAARRTYRLCREQAPRAVGTTLASLVDNVVAPGRAFVQFINLDEYPAGLVAFHSDNGPRITFVDLGNVTVRQIQQVSDLWLTLASESSWERKADVLDEVLRWVGHEIMTPVVGVLQEAGIHQIVLCPTGVLEPIPLHAAPVGTNMVGDLFQTSYAPSAAVLSRLAGFPPEALVLDLIVESSGAYVPSELGLAVLKGPEQEARVLRRLAPDAQVMGGKGATASSVLAAIATSRVAHLAGHGRAEADELASGIWLAGTTTSAALLSAARVHAGPSLRGTSLVVLSACETARHPLGGSAIQAWRGLDSAFLSRGTRAVVSSMWEISDLVALIYNVVFHARLAEGATIANAHAFASNSIRTATIDPRAASLLSSVRPDWRIGIESSDLARSYWWSVFRPSGICW